jgi:hypothetical protein
MRFYSWIAVALACAAQSVAVADDSLRPVDTSIRSVAPQRMMRVRWEAGQLIPTSPWVEYGDFIPTSPCQGGETLVFDHFRGQVFFRGPQYHNPYWANDIQTLVDARYNGATASSIEIGWFWNPNRTDPPSGAQQCIILLFMTEQFDAECENVHEDTALQGVLVDYGILNAGAWRSPLCLRSIGGIPTPATPSDDGNPGTELLGGWMVIYAQAFDLNTGAITLASGAQPLLGYIQGIGSSTPTQWDGDACNQYPADDSGVLGGALRFWVESGCQPSGGDVDGDGCVDDADLLAVLFAFGNSGSGLDEDVNCDGTVDDADLLEVLFNFGNGC